MNIIVCGIVSRSPAELKEDRDANRMANIMRGMVDDYPSNQISIPCCCALDDLGGSWERMAAELRKIEIVEVNRRPQSKDEIASQDLEYSRGVFKRSYIAVGVPVFRGQH